MVKNRPSLQVQKAFLDDYVKIIAIGDMMIHTANNVLQAVTDLASTEKYNKIIIDMAEVNFVDSFALGIMIRCKEVIENKFGKKGQITFLLNENVFQAIKVTQLEDYLNLQIKQ